ncbi:UPF0481 protein [Spatholobus suberectus]|nr:UPF0481 protein [Spatholobus suberectus]
MEEETNHHTIDIWKAIDRERLATMELKLSENPKLLSKAAGNRSCCIFRVPQSLIEANGKAYQPRIVSIGPYHRGQPRLNMIEEHKWRYLGSLLSRTHTTGLSLEDLFKAIAPLESEARECYSESIHLDSHDFTEMMILDGCFIIELFRKVASRLSQARKPNPFLHSEPTVRTNKTTREKSTATLSTLAMLFFNNSLQRPDEAVVQNDTKRRHLLDLVRSSFIPNELETEPRKRVVAPTHVILCVSKLRRAGVKISRGKDSDSFLHVTFRHGVIEMPTLTVDDFMSSFLLNCVAFEQCYGGFWKQFTAYVTLLDCLINTYRDVEYLCDRNVIENHFGTEGEMASFINNAGRDVAVDLDLCYLSQLFNDVHKYYRSSWHVQLASFKYTYFDTPWSFISALAALVLLVLTVAQTYFAAYQYFDNPNSS